MRAKVRVRGAKPGVLHGSAIATGGSARPASTASTPQHR